MGEKLLSLLREADEHAGIWGRVKIVLITRVSECEIGNLPDHPEVVAKCEHAIERLKKHK